MTSGAYYSEFDKNAAAWLRELIKRGLIAAAIIGRAMEHLAVGIADGVFA